MNAPLSKEEWLKLRRSTLDVLPGLIEEIGQERALLTYQQQTVSLLESGTQVLFIEKSRRIGLTWGLASYAVLRAGRNKSAGGMDAMYISYSQEMTREFIDACAMWAKAFSQAVLDMDEFLFDDGDPDGDKSIQAFRIRFASGFEIVALSSAPRSLRGKQGLVIIDEAAFVDSLAELLKAALAFLIWGGQVVVCSTHDGTENPFNEYIQQILGGRLNYKHLKIDFDEALKQGLYQRICLVTGQKWSPEAEAEWRQETIDQYGDGADEELFCVPSKGGGAWLSGTLIEARMTLTEADAPIIRIELPDDYLQKTPLEQAQIFEPQFDKVRHAAKLLDEANMHAGGYDPARKVDPAVVQLLAIEKDMHRRSAITVEMRKVPFKEQKRISRYLIEASPRIVGFAIDATGMGMNLAEDLGRGFGSRESEEDDGLIIQVSLRGPWYNEHFPPLKTAFEDDTIALVKDREHSSDLRLVKVIRGVPMIPEERQGEKGKKRHGDFAVALGLAYFASRMRWVEYAYQAVPDYRRPGGDLQLAEDSFMLPPGEETDVEIRNWYDPPLGARIRGGL